MSEFSIEQAYKTSLKDVVNHAAMVVILDQTGLLVDANEKFCEQFAGSLEALRNKHFPLLDLEYHTKKEFETLWDSLLKGRPWQGRIRAKSLQGELIWLDATLYPYHEGDKLQHCLGVLFDITKHQQVEKDLVRATLEANQASHEKSLFLANISHELRTPLHAILSFASLGKERATQDNLLNYFGKIHDSGARLLTLIDRLLDLSKLQSGKSAFCFAPAEISYVVNQVLGELAPLIEQRQLTVEVNPPSLSTEVECDAHAIMQVITNLIANAVAYTPKGKLIRITFGRQHIPTNQTKKDAVVLKIADQGPGIPPDELKTIFEPFVQSKNTQTGAGGTGLGLAISKEIVEGHGGLIRCENLEDGAIFLMILPTVPGGG